MALTLDKIARFVLPAPRAGEFFAPSERRTLAAAAEVLLEGCPVAIGAAEVAASVDRFLLRGASRRAWRIRVLLTLIEFLPLLILRGRFSRLALAERARLVRERYVGGRNLWALCAKVRHLVYLGAYGGRPAEQAVGFIPVALRARHWPVSGAPPERETPGPREEPPSSMRTSS